MKVTQGERLKELMGIYHISQKELGKRVGIPKGSLSMYVSGQRKMKQDRIKAIADAFNVDEAWILGYDVPMRKESFSDSESVVSHIKKVVTMTKDDQERYFIEKAKRDSAFWKYIQQLFNMKPEYRQEVYDYIDFMYGKKGNEQFVESV